ncbi:hypothetical protein BAL199_01504 [alpha proteobacterium BAL199]|nr:hypothetical protein BAL199_01504 [alpha proteobacterium BAL199]
MPGCYGKIPALGDFLSRNLPGTFVEAWDGWLRAAMSACARDGNDDWIDHYLSGPVWRFAIASPAIGEVSRAGVMVPSVDRIGRSFPMTVVVEIPDGMTAIDMATTWAEGFERAEALVLAAIGRSLAAEAFVTHVESLPTPSAAVDDGLAARQHWRPDPKVGFGVRMATTPSDEIGGPGLAAALALPLLADAVSGYSIWWHPSYDDRPANTILFAGLPPPEAARGMLVGSWKDWGWQD